MSEKILLNNQAVPKSQTTVQFGALKSPTPIWAKNVFRSWSVFTLALAFYIAGTHLVSEDIKTEVMLAIKASDMLVLGLSKMFGIVPKK